MNNRISYIIAASGIALILLVFIQAKWMKQSSDLINEQFDQKVSMAMCTAIENIAKVKGEGYAPACNELFTEEKGCCASALGNYPIDDEMMSIIRNSLDNYDIQMPFELSVHESNINLTCPSTIASGYSCSLNPLTNEDNLRLNIIFPGKQKYVLSKLWFMIILSLIILLFIVGVFAYATFYLLKQKKIGERNKDFFNHMAHEFRTPLTNIGLAANMMKKKYNDQLLEVIASENKELKEHVNHVLSMANLENGQYQLEKENLDLLPLIHDISDQFQIRLNQVNGRIQVYNHAHETKVSADKFHISNAIRNLIDNSIKYNNKEPQIDITLENQDGYLKIAIRDNGIGIRKNEQKLIFEKFFRVQEGDTYDTKGFGIGLSYVKKIMDLHKGEIVVNSEWNKGSSFSLMFPKIRTT